jgi:hypothetical protein
VDLIAEVEDLPPGSPSPGRHAKICLTAPTFSEAGSSMASDFRDRDLGEMHVGSERSTTKTSQRASIVAQDIPEHINRQRRLLKDFYADWREEKSGPSEGPVDEDVLMMAHLWMTGIDSALKDCQDFYSTADHLTSAFSQMASVFLLCANAYPKHAPVCYTLAESCFNMAKISSRLISASWKLCHGFTMSLMISGLEEISYHLHDLMFAINTPIFWYLQLHTDLVEHVMTTKSFERDEEFQKGYEQPPAESQISAFASVVDEAKVMLKETIRQLAQAKRDRPEKKKVSTSSSACESQDAEAKSEEGDRPEQKEFFSASSSARESKDAEAESEGNRLEQKEVSTSSSCDEEEVSASSSCDEEEDETDDEESEISKNIRGIKDRISSLVGDVKTFYGLLKNLKISEC